MIDLQGIKRVTSDLFSRLVGVALNQIRWEDEPEANAWTADPMLRLNIKGLAGLGWEEERREDDPNGVNDGIVIVAAPRLFTLTVKVESLSQRLQDKNNALAIASNLITRTSRTSSVEFLNDYYGVCDYSDIRYVPYNDSDGRAINRYIVDFICETEDNDVDGTPGAGGWIGEVIGDGKVKDGAVERDVPYDVKG